METGKTSKYLKYAIGEIILVVIGILIALAINNWNENAKTRSNVSSYLLSLSEEVSNNIKRLETGNQYAQENLRRTVKVLEELNDDSKKIDNDYMYHTGLNPFVTFELESTVFKDIINANVLSNVKDNSLRNQILKISVLLEDYYRLNTSAGESWKEYLLPYLQEHINVTNLWDSLGVVKMPKLKFKNNLDAFVNNKDFANILAYRMRMLANMYYRTNQYIEQLKELKIALNNAQIND